MSDPIYKVSEIVGTSKSSISDAIDSAIARSGETLRNLGWFEVTQIRGSVESGRVDSYQVTVKAGFRVDD